MSKLSHVDSDGKAKMVDVGNKTVQQRYAKASGKILLAKQTIEEIKNNNVKKGDVLTVAEIAGIQAAKKNSELIPLCHPLQITKVLVVTTITDYGVDVVCEVKCNGQTGVEMEALTGVSITLLTIYDMCKAIDKSMKITGIELIEKTKKNID